MDFIKSIPYELIIKDKTITIKIGELKEWHLLIFEDESVNDFQSNIKTNTQKKIKIMIPDKFSFVCLKFMLHRIIFIENNNEIGGTIFLSILKTIENKLTEMINKFFQKDDNESLSEDQQYDKLIYFKDLNESEKWMIIFSNQFLNFKKIIQHNHFNILNDLNDNLFKDYKKILDNCEQKLALFINLRQKIILNKINSIDEQDDFDLLSKNAWTFLKNQSYDKQNIIYLETTKELTLKKLGDELEKFMFGVLNHQKIADMLSKMLKVIPVESYSTVLGTSISMIENNRVTPALEERTYSVYSKVLYSKEISTMDCLVKMLFRSMGIESMNVNKLMYIFIALLYSGYTLEPNLKEYIISILSNSKSFNIQLIAFLDMDFTNYSSIIMLVNKPEITNEIDNGLAMVKKFKITNNNIPSVLIIRNLLIINYMYYILTNPDFNYVFKTKYVKSLKNKITSIMSALPFDDTKIIKIVEIIMKCYFKSLVKGEINIKHFMLTLKKDLNRSWFEDIEQYSEFKFKLEGLTLSDNDIKGKKINLEPMFNNMLFGNFLNNCQLCDNLYFICKNHCYILACENHNICYECWFKMFATKIYSQGQQIDIMNFVCPICRKPEKNSIYNIPENFYEAPEQHCLCSYVNCMNIVKMSNVPPCRAIDLDNENDVLPEQENEQQNENYCQQHLRLFRLMSYVPVEMLNTVKECPNCFNPINRVEGCSHITCQCGQQFCWVCDYVHENNHIAYSHPSYCRGNYSWERALSLLLDVSNRILSEIRNLFETQNYDDNETEVNLEIHNLISVWLSNDFSRPEINAQSFWSFQNWLNTILGYHNESTLPQIIAEICEWIQTPIIIVNPITSLATALKNELLRLQNIRPDLLEIL